MKLNKNLNALAAVSCILIAASVSLPSVGKDADKKSETALKKSESSTKAAPASTAEPEAKGEHSSKQAKKVQSGAELFKQYCSNCHAEGGNLVKPHHKIVGSKKLSTLAAFKQYLSSPPGHMPYYSQIVNDQETLQKLYDYCKTLNAKPSEQALLPTSAQTSHFND
jgi:mono/diheme cytochrome c family protein